MCRTGMKLSFSVALFFFSTFLTDIKGHIDSTETAQIHRGCTIFRSVAKGKCQLEKGLSTVSSKATMQLLNRFRRDIIVAGFDKWIIKGGATVGKWVLRWFRVRRALGIMKAGATLLKKDEDLRVVYYTKAGGAIRARRDFWMIDVFGTKVGKRLNQQYFEKGTVGDSFIELHGKYSKELPYPALVLYRKNSPEVTRGTVTVVLYK